MSKISKLILAFLLGCYSNVPLKAMCLSGTLSKDTILVGRVISMDTSSINVGQSKIGYLTYYGLFHLEIKLGDGRTVRLVRVFNVMDEYNLFRQRFGFRINDNRIFYVYRYAPCDCQLPRMSGNCKDGIYHPANSNVTQPYSQIYRIIGTRAVP
jgi:hypothetical protein